MKNTASGTNEIRVYNPNHLPTIPYSKLENLQGDLKRLSEEDLDKLKASILKHGIFVPKFVWSQDEKYWTMDGHQTKKALTSLHIDGYTIPDIPIVEIEAEDFQDAAEKLLQINSRYGKIEKKTGFFDLYDLDLSLLDQVEIPELEDLLGDEQPEEAPEIEFTEELLETHNYIVLYFENEMDWMAVTDMLEIEPTLSLWSRPGTRFIQKGVGRVVNGVTAIERIKHS